MTALKDASQNAPIPLAGRKTGRQLPIPRTLCNSDALSGLTGRLTLSYFRADAAQTVTQMAAMVGATPAAATPTLCRMGIWTATPATGALVASIAATPNDTALFAAAYTRYPKAFSASADLVDGTFYAAGVLIVTASTAPTWWGYRQGLGSGAGSIAAVYFEDEPISGVMTGQADLPASGSPSGPGIPTAPYFEVW